MRAGAAGGGRRRRRGKGWRGRAARGPLRRARRGPGRAGGMRHLLLPRRSPLPARRLPRLAAFPVPGARMGPRTMVPAAFVPPPGAVAALPPGLGAALPSARGAAAAHGGLCWCRGPLPRFGEPGYGVLCWPVLFLVLPCINPFFQFLYIFKCW